MNYFILLNNQQQGPFSLDELRTKGLTSDTLVWHEGMTQWMPAWQVDELRPLLGLGPRTGATPPPPPDFADTPQDHQPQPAGQPRPDGFAQPEGQRQPAGATAYATPTGQAEPPRRHRHRGCLVCLVVIAVVLFLLALTNPSPNDHREAILRETTTESEQVETIADPTQRSIMRIFSSVGQGVVDAIMGQLVDDGLEYHNYIFFSTTTVHSDTLKKDVRCSFGILGYVHVSDMRDILPQLFIHHITGSTETTTGPDDDDADDEQSSTTSRTDSIARTVAGQAADQAIRQVMKEVSQQTDSATAHGVQRIIDDIKDLIK